MTTLLKFFILTSLFTIFSACATKKSHALACYKGDISCIAHGKSKKSDCNGVCFVKLKKGRRS